MYNLSATALIPLWARAKDYEAKDSVLNDKFSNDLLNKIDFDFKIFDQQNSIIKKATIADLVVRTKVIDNFLLSSLDEKKIVLNLGAGFDTRDRRLGICNTYYHIDFEHIISQRKIFFNNSQAINISQNILDFDFLNDFSKKEPIIIAEGLFMYYKRDILIKFISKLKNTFKSYTLIIETGSWLIPYTSHPFFRIFNDSIKYSSGYYNSKTYFKKLGFSNVETIFILSEINKYKPYKSLLMNGLKYFSPFIGSQVSKIIF